MRLIDADAAIKAVEKSMYENPHENTIHRSMHDHEHRHFLTILMGLPPAQPEINRSEIPNNWIPCSERLPEIDKDVLVTDGELCWVCSLFESPDIEDGLYQWEDNYGHWHEFETWVAWMPLPEPYQGGEQE